MAPQDDSGGRHQTEPKYDGSGRRVSEEPQKRHRSDKAHATKSKSDSKKLPWHEWTRFFAAALCFCDDIVNLKCRQTVASFRLSKKIGNAGILFAKRRLDFVAVSFDIGNRLIDAVGIGVRLDFIRRTHAGSSRVHTLGIAPL
ncbi:MAG TPA: hypothetical protein VKE72_05910 [Methylocella sp.]|nr:hypothetical protein [Methylocella sp.]